MSASSLQATPSQTNGSNLMPTMEEQPLSGESTSTFFALEGGGISAESEDRMVQRLKNKLIELGHEISSQLRFEIWEEKNPIKKRQ